MGAPFSATLANIFMELFEIKLLPRILLPCIKWFRYVDDVLAIFPINCDPILFLTDLNNLHPSIQFSIELETNNSISFLDMEIFNINGFLSFNIFKKPTHINSYIHSFSSHSSSTKRGVIIGMFLRCLRICSPQFLDPEILKTKEIFINLGYSLTFLNSCLKSAREKFFHPCQNNLSGQNILALPFETNLKDF